MFQSTAFFEKYFFILNVFSSMFFLFPPFFYHHSWMNGISSILVLLSVKYFPEFPVAKFPDHSYVSSSCLRRHPPSKNLFLYRRPGFLFLPYRMLAFSRPYSLLHLIVTCAKIRINLLLTLSENNFIYFNNFYSLPYFEHEIIFYLHRYNILFITCIFVHLIFT